MSNILRLCEILEASPNELLGHEEAKQPDASADMTESENTAGPKENVRRRIVLSVVGAVCCIILGMILGFVIKSYLPGDDATQEPPVDFSIRGYDLFSEGGSQQTRTLRLNFISNVTNPEYEYKIIVTNDDGVSREFEVQNGAQGTYTGTFDVALGYSHYLVSVSMKVDESTYSDALIKIWNISETGYSWKKIED